MIKKVRSRIIIIAIIASLIAICIALGIEIYTISKSEKYINAWQYNSHKDMLGVSYTIKVRGDKYAILRNDVTHNAGVVDSLGNWLLEPKYGSIEPVKHTFGVLIVEDYCGVGLWQLGKGWIIEPKHRDIVDYYPGPAFMVIDDFNPFEYEHPDLDLSNMIYADVKAEDDFVVYYPTEFVLFESEDKIGWGLYNLRTKRVVIEPKFHGIWLNSNETFGALDMDNKEYTFDKEGCLIQ